MLSLDEFQHFEHETLKSRYGALYALGKLLLMLARFPEHERKVLLKRAWILTVSGPERIG